MNAWVMIVVVALMTGMVSCRKTPEVTFQSVMEKADQLARQGDKAGACTLLIQMSNDKRMAERRGELVGCFVNYYADYVRSQCVGGRAESVIKQTEVYMTNLPPGMALALAGRVANSLLGSGAWKQAGEMPGLVESYVADSPERKGLLCELRMALLLHDGKIKEAEVLYRRELNGIPDENAVRGLRVLAGALPDRGDSLCEEIMDASTGRRLLQEAAAGGWVKAAGAQGNGAEIGRRLVVIRQKGISDRVVMALIDDTYTVLLANPSADTLAPVYAMCEQMGGASAEKGVRQRVAAYLLDMGFFLEKYAESLKLIEDGVLGEGNPQAEALTCKIKAHLALKEGRIDEAVDYFRQFMKFIEKGSSAREYDALDRMWVTRDMILGLNAKRIGDILAKADRLAESVLAYKEARANYEKAMKDFPDETSRENQKIRRSLAGIPSM